MSDTHRDAMAAAVSAVLARLASSSTEAAEPGSGSALSALVAALGLSDFERDVLVLCAAMELEPSTAARCQELGGKPYPTFALCLHAFDTAHWSAITPRGALRRFRLLDVDEGATITTARLTISERVLHFLVGVAELDARLFGTASRCVPPVTLPPSYERAASELSSAYARAGAVSLTGGDGQTRREVAAAAAELCGLALYAVAAEDLPSDPVSRGELARLWEREAVLLPAALLIDVVELTRPSPADAFAALLNVPVVMSSAEPVKGAMGQHSPVEVPALPHHEQQQVWRAELNGSGASVDDASLAGLVAQFSLPAHEIRSAARRARETELDVTQAAWAAGLEHARLALDEMGQRVSSRAEWADLVLAREQVSILREIVAQVRQRPVVYREWGFDAVLRRGLGVTALFAGASGTGKTLAAEVIAGELGLDLFVIDLSQVVSKYIGETEKNLRKVFDAAERGGAVLLFDEADALFGKRSEVKDSHDRYANLEVSYLLMRMEAYRGLAILTTNQKSALDSAFMRRLRFVVDFPFPDAAERKEIWRRVIPTRAPTSDLTFERLAELSIPGGNIRNIALSAAFLAADEGSPMEMRHMAAAARTEFIKLERSLTTSDTAGWT